MKDPRDRTNMLVLAVVAVIILIGGFAMYLVKQNLDQQRCEAERRMDCRTIDVPNSDAQPPPS